MRKKAQALCTGCARPVSPGKDFCPHCGAPASSYALTAPYERVLSEGYAWRRAVQRPNLVILIGMWITWGPMFVGCVVMAIGTFVEFSKTADVEGSAFKDRMSMLLYFLLFGVGGCVLGRLLYR